MKAHQEKTDRERMQILRTYPWSSYRSYTGLSKPLDFVDYHPVLTLVNRSKKKQASSYRRFVEAGVRDIDAAFIETKRQSRFSLGSDASHERSKTMYQEMLQAYDKKEDVSLRCEGKYASVDEVIKVTLERLNAPQTVLAHRSRNSMVRPVVAYALCCYAGCTQRAAAEVMGLRSGVAISLQLTKLNAQPKKSKGLQKLLAELKQRLAPEGQ